MIIINLKNYKIGEENLNLIRKFKSMDYLFCVPATEIKEAVKIVGGKRVFAQHVDFQEKGKTTGFLIPESIKSSGASGTLLNHSEHKLNFDVLRKTIRRCLDLKLKVIVCVSSLSEARKILGLNGIYAVAYEEPRLIGTGKSVTKSNSKKILEFVKLFKGKKAVPLCGAGIRSAGDYGEALRLGCKGVLVSSAFTEKGGLKNG